ncbi:cyclophilin-like superfamily protein [Pararhizobium polonicum]|uniref:Cyclophilin-like superfamily protein n=2 Tax=Pararhizobium polonicum TaxID=1612624 RepID=A0A1C7P3J8_9HYPH|nr:cyclophilin-like superfamily protein [Pararhizobium polonicum]
MQKAPATCRSFLARLPFLERVIHVRWSGQGVWMPLGDMKFDVPFENATSYPSPGEIILYPGGVSETEILLAYGRVNFASMAGQLAGNHFLTITEGHDRLALVGQKVLWEGAQTIAFEQA